MKYFNGLYVASNQKKGQLFSHTIYDSGNRYFVALKNKNIPLKIRILNNV